jgi:hypothetical protein
MPREILESHRVHKTRRSVFIPLAILETLQLQDETSVWEMASSDNFGATVNHFSSCIYLPVSAHEELDVLVRVAVSHD